MDALKAALAHEQYVTSLIHTIYESAYTVKDFRTMQFLDWFVKEQGEEEATASDLIKKMELFGTDAKGLYLLDQELGPGSTPHPIWCCNSLISTRTFPVGTSVFFLPPGK